MTMTKKKEILSENSEKSIEEMFDLLDEISKKLEDRETSLEDSFQYYKEGMELLKACSEKLDTVEKKMLQINEDGTVSEFSRGLNKEDENN